MLTTQPVEQKLSVIIITYNEEDNIRDCLNSVKWADEIIVIDSKSTDKTVDFAKEFTDIIFLTDNLTYGQKRNIGIENASCDWIFWLDADERVTQELKKEIVNASEHNRFDAYLVNRKSFFINKFIKHCGWYPDYTLRLFRKSSGIKFNEALVHEKIHYKGKIGKIESELLHYTDRDYEHYINKLNNYTTLSAKDLSDKKRKAGISDIIFRPALTFFRMYFWKLGILDGFTGLVLCILSSFHVLMKYAKLYLLNKRQTNG